VAIVDSMPCRALQLDAGNECDTCTHECARMKEGDSSCVIIEKSDDVSLSMPHISMSDWECTCEK